jgi:hypothetical protein
MGLRGDEIEQKKVGNVYMSKGDGTRENSGGCNIGMEG